MVIAEVVAFHVADRNFEHFALGQLLGVRRVGALDANVDGLADVLQSSVAHERARQQPGFAKNLKAVADAQDESAVGGGLGDAEDFTVVNPRMAGNDAVGLARFQ